MKLFKFPVLLILLLAGILFAGAGRAEDKNPDALWNIVSLCIDSSNPNYCRDCEWPIAGKCNVSRCEQTTELWKLGSDYVAIRDKKMCGCPQRFVHGLVLPRERVSGVEDEKRPAGIWQFAWDIAKEKGIEAPETALAVNCASCRSQNQLHVHVARLNREGRELSGSNRSATVEDPGQVWKKAGELARNAGLKDYSILVKQEGRAFLVVIDRESTEKEYTEYMCRK